MREISVISGGSSGLGLEIAEHLIKSGKNVLILGRNKNKLGLAASRLKKAAKNNIVDSFTCNVGNEADINKIGDYLKNRQFSVDYLFNNAGIGLFQATEDSTSTMIDSVFEANLKGMILLTTEVLRLTPENKELTIVNIMSTSALLGRSEETIYCAAKWGARGYTEALRVEMKGKKRNIIAVYPGGMKTNFWNIPDLNRNIDSFMNPEEVAIKIVNTLTDTDKLLVTDITINRKA
jgi:uncharacterized protein